MTGILIGYFLVSMLVSGLVLRSAIIRAGRTEVVTVRPAPTIQVAPVAVSRIETESWGDASFAYAHRAVAGR